MATMVAELYDALKKAGVDDATAKAAAQAVMGVEDREHLATKADLLGLKADILELKSDLTWRMLLMTGAFIAAVGALKVFA